MALQVYSKEHSLDIVHASASKAFVSENSLSSSASGNALGGFEGKVGNSWALGGTNGGGSDLTLNQKVMHKFLKVCVEEEGPP